MDYRDVSPQEIVNSLFSDMKSKYEKVSSHEYLEWLKNIIERHGKEKEEVFAITDDSDIWYDKWYEALPEIFWEYPLETLLLLTLPPTLKFPEERKLSAID